MNPSILPNHVYVASCVSCGLAFRSDSVSAAQCSPCHEIGSAFFSMFRSRDARSIEEPPRVLPACPGEVGHADVG